jgi:opacity protein-like surface antigen
MHEAVSAFYSCDAALCKLSKRAVALAVRRNDDRKSYVLEARVRLSSRIIVKAALAVLFLPVQNLFASEAAQPSNSATAESSSDSSFVGDPAELLPVSPISSGSMGAATPYADGRSIYYPKIELFLGYSYLRAMPTPTTGNRLVWLNGGSTSIAFNVKRYFGIVGDFGGFNDSRLEFRDTGAPSTVVSSSGTAFTYLLGPRFSYRGSGRWTIFAQGLFGAIHASDVTASSGCTGAGCTVIPSENSFALTAGGGVDLRLHRHLALRIAQAEYMMTRFENLNTGSTEMQNDLRLSSGLVFRFGGGPLAPERAPVTYSCSANPAAVFQGEPIAVTGAASNLNPARTAVYTWAGDGVTGDGAAATVATGSLIPGSYTVRCGVREEKNGKESIQSSEMADSSTTFTVKEFEPPTLSCAADPASIKPGDTATVTASGVSPQNRPLTYTFSATVGNVTSSGSTATFSSAGAPSGSTDVTCNAVDDKGHAATTTASLNIEAPPQEPSPEQVRLEARLALHSIFFPTAQPRATHPEGGLVESQQRTLATLATDFKSYLAMQPKGHLTLTGHADSRGSAELNQALTERRVQRAKQFLVEQGVPEDSIDTRAVGKDQELTADQVRGLVEQNPDLSDAQKQNVLRRLNVVVLAQNRRVDITLSNTGQKSLQIYPFNAADSITLLEERSVTPRKKATPATKPQ